MIARLILSTLEKRVEEISKILSQKHVTPNHPDLLYFPSDSKLGIEQARQIKDHFLLKPYQLKGKVVVLEDASVLTLEAQNALLKTLEEPPEGTLLILGAPSEDKLLPTVLSRCQIVILDTPHVIRQRRIHKRHPECDSGSQNIPDQVREDIEKLLNSTIEERFEYIGNLKEKEEFLQTMIQYFRNQMVEVTSNQLSSDRSTFVTAMELRELLKKLLQAEEWAAQNVNIRAILEYLMLIMPSILKPQKNS